MQKTSTLTLCQAKLRFLEDEKYVGVLECWATDSFGAAKELCTFQLMAADKNGTFDCCESQRSCSQSDISLLYFIVNSSRLARKY